MNEEQIIQEIAIDGAVTQAWSGSHRLSLSTQQRDGLSLHAVTLF